MGTNSDKLLGRVAVASKAISQQQLAEALEAQESLTQHQPLGSLLVALGFLDEKKLARVEQLHQQVVAKAKRKAEAERAAQAQDETAESASEAAADDAIELEPAPLEAGADEPKASPAASAGPPCDLDSLLRDAVEAGASDIHVHSGAPIKFRLRQQMYDHGSGPLSEQQARELIYPVLSDENRARFEDRGELDFCHVIPEVGRFRANVYRQLRGIDVALRHIPHEPPTLEQLGLPKQLGRFTKYHQGMVLCTGPAGCGKSSTMAALVNLLNEERTEHILTIEDPIEYLHPSKGCVVNQRSVHAHTESFARGLRAGLREDPDVIVIGELRDRETIALALSAAETGHFVLATLHTDNAIRTINRLIGAFPPDQQEQVRAMLSESLKVVISQRLVPTADETGLVPALELLIVNRAVGNLIREQKTVQIHSTLQTGASQGMCLLDHSLARLVKTGQVSKDDALRVCEDPRMIP